MLNDVATHLHFAKELVLVKPARHTSHYLFFGVFLDASQIEGIITTFSALITFKTYMWFFMFVDAFLLYLVILLRNWSVFCRPLEKSFGLCSHLNMKYLTVTRRMKRFIFMMKMGVSLVFWYCMPSVKKKKRKRWAMTFSWFSNV